LIPLVAPCFKSMKTPICLTSLPQTQCCFLDRSISFLVRIFHTVAKAISHCSSRFIEPATKCLVAKRHRAGALHALADGLARLYLAPASWSAAALCRFYSNVLGLRLSKIQPAYATPSRGFDSRDVGRHIKSHCLGLVMSLFALSLLTTTAQAGQGAASYLDFDDSNPGFGTPTDTGETALTWSTSAAGTATARPSGTQLTIGSVATASPAPPPSTFQSISTAAAICRASSSTTQT
jgi:hypothetical protein